MRAVWNMLPGDVARHITPFSAPSETAHTETECKNTLASLITPTVYLNDTDSREKITKGSLYTSFGGIVSSGLKRKSL